MCEYGWATDDGPAIFEKYWPLTSWCRQGRLVRGQQFAHDKGARAALRWLPSAHDKGHYLCYGRVSGPLIIDNEDWAEHRAQTTLCGRRYDFVKPDRSARVPHSR